MDNNIKIKKRDKTLENYDPSKVERVVKAAGLNDLDAKNLSMRVTAWLNSLNKNLIASALLRDKVEEELQKVNPNAYNLFRWYEKTKERN